MKIKLVIVAVVAAGCGDVAPKSAGPDAARGDAAKTDAAVDAVAPRCNPSAPFGPPVPVTSLNTSASEESPYLTQDELTIYFSSTRSGTLGGYDIFMATRPTRDAAWSNIVPVMGVNTSALERQPMISGDGLALYALTNADPNYEISVATRSSPSGVFGAFSPIAAVNSTANDIGGMILPDQSALYFYSNRSGNYDIYRAPRHNGQFETPLAVSGVQLNTADMEAAPIVTPDELTLFFESDRAGGVGGGDIYMATRATTADGFGAPLNLQTVNTTGSEQPSWISADGCVLYITYGPCCSYDIAVATRGM